MVIPVPEHPAEEQHNVAIYRSRSLEGEFNVCPNFDFHGGRGGGSQGRKVGSRPPNLVTEDRDDADAKRVHSKREIVGEEPLVVVDNFVSDTAIQSATTFITPASTIRSVPMRDMGTEMTPIASQEPSRTGTPIRATTPMHSPPSSRPSTPGRSVPSSILIGRGDCQVSRTGRELSEKELQMRTRREIMILGEQLGKANIAAWGSKEEEEQDASISFHNVPLGQPAVSIIHTLAVTWEEAENTKYMASYLELIRFKQEEVKIQAWENHQKAKTEAEMRRIEVEVESMKARAQEKLMEKLAVTGHRSEEKRVAAEARRNQQGTRTTIQQLDYNRDTGQIASSCFCWSCCC